MTACAKTELCIFDKPGPQIVIENYAFETVHPINSIQNDTGSNIEFKITGSDSHYLDLNDTLLYVKCMVYKTGTTKLVAADDDKIIPANNLLNSLFSDIVVKFNDKQIEGGNYDYTLKSLLDVSLNFGLDTKRNIGGTFGYFYNYDEAARKKLVNKSNNIELCGPLSLDTFNQPKYLIPGVSVYMNLKRNTDGFILKSTADDYNNATIKILDARLYVKRCRVSPAVQLGHNIGLKSKNAIYPYRKTRLIKYNLGNGMQQFYKDQIFGDVALPKFLLVTFQGNNEHSGSIGHDSTLLTNANVESIRLTRNTDYNECYDNINFTDGDGYVEAYVKSLIRNVGLLNKNMNNGINEDAFKNKFPLFTFVLSPDFDIDQKQLPRQGNLKLDIKFKSALTTATTVIVYGIFDAEIQISNTRAIYLL